MGAGAELEAARLADVMLDSGDRRTGWFGCGSDAGD
jgi:hypothetical protein